MDMQALLAEIELDMQELKYLTEAFTRESNGALRGVLRRNILLMRSRLDEMLQLLESVSQTIESNKPMEVNQPVIQRQDEEVSLSAEETTVEIGVEDKKAVTDEVKREEIEKVIIPIISSPILGERIKLAEDLHRSISLNDSFRFSRELFNGDSGFMSRVLEQISAMNSLEMALAFLATKVNVSEENEAMADFQELLKKYFN